MAGSQVEQQLTGLRQKMALPVMVQQLSRIEAEDDSIGGGQKLTQIAAEDGTLAGVAAANPD
jgi:hypothetical protein